MTIRNATTITLTVLLCICAGSFTQKCTAAAVQNTFYVSPAGNDKNPGTKAAPFKTIQRARDEVRKVNGKMSGDVEVILGGGTYQLDETLVFDHRDGGTGGHNVVYKTAPGETPIISGGKTISGWQADANGRWRAKTDLKNFRQLYVGGSRAVRARGEAPAGIELFGENGYKTTAVEMADWKNQDDIEFCYYVIWCHTRCKVQSIKRDGERAIVSMLQPYFTHARKKEGVKVNLPNYIENALELLDEPGRVVSRPAKRHGLLYAHAGPGHVQGQRGCARD